MIWYVVSVALLLSGCSAEAPAPLPSDPPARASGGAPLPEGLRAPHGQAEVDCDQPPDDPPQAGLYAAAAAEDLEGSVRGLEALAGEHPASGSTRVRLGEVLLRAQPPRAEPASRWFDRALELHARGCELGDGDHWAALEGRALSHMMLGDYAGAVSPLRTSVSRWPGVRSTHYNLACALCQTGDIDGCVRELEAVLGELRAPEFLRDRTRPAAQYRPMIERDPDLAPLRADRARLDALLGG